MKRKAKKVTTSFPATVDHNGVGPHIWVPLGGVIYLAPGFKKGNRVRVTVTKVKRERGERART